MIDATGPAVSDQYRVHAERCSYVCQGFLFFILENRQDPGFAECGHDRDGPLAVEGRLLSGHEVSGLEGPGAVGRSLEGQHGGAAAE